MIKRIIGILFLLSTLSSCATFKTQMETPAQKAASPKASWEDRQAALERIQNWQINGKIAVKTPKDSGSASVNWSQRQRNYSIALAGPLGSHQLNLTGQPGRVTLQTSEGKRASASSPEQLLAKNWGFNLPVSSMRYWVRGLPVPGIPAKTQFDSYRRLTSLSQQGWNIQFQSYVNHGGVDLPNRLSLYSPAMQVKIIIYQWSA